MRISRQTLDTWDRCEFCANCCDHHSEIGAGIAFELHDISSGDILSTERCNRHYSYEEVEEFNNDPENIGRLRWEVVGEFDLN